MSRFQILRPLRDFERGADADRIHVLLEQLVERALPLIGLRGDLEQQKRAVRALSPAVTVTVDVAVEIEQALGASRVVLAELGMHRGVVASGEGDDR